MSQINMRLADVHNLYLKSQKNSYKPNNSSPENLNVKSKPDRSLTEHIGNTWQLSIMRNYRKSAGDAYGSAIMELWRPAALDPKPYLDQSYKRNLGLEK